MLENKVDFGSKICDVGCSTGEFLEYIGWRGQRFGMEINETAKSIAQKHSITFTKTIVTENLFFDVILFRGTIQHVTEPFNYLTYAANSLKPGGLLIFLATPNIESIYYRIFNELPALEKAKCFFLPGKEHLKNLCERQGFEFICSQSPYIGSGYEKPLRDFFSFFMRLLFRSNRLANPFPGNMMNVIFSKESA